VYKDVFVSEQETAMWAIINHERETYMKYAIDVTSVRMWWQKTSLMSSTTMMGLSCPRGVARRKHSLQNWHQNRVATRGHVETWT
jgi:hypothetical protein